jgi:protein-S-isoprenylcysteine O-methyltransferase Ste14
MEQEKETPKLTRTRVKANILVKPALLALLLFISRGTLLWWEGWVYFLLYLGWSFANVAMLFAQSPALLSRRIAADWPAQPLDRALSFLLPVFYAASLIVSARFADIPSDPDYIYLRVAAFGGLAWCYWGASRALLTNEFAIKGIAILPGHTVCSVGPYAGLRHPLYAAVLLGCLLTPPALGSVTGLWPAAGAALLTVLRTAFEDRFLMKNLPGYPEYSARVKWRLVPWIW